jgi:SAM-dependent methyltransferase
MQTHIEPASEGARLRAYEIGCFPGGYLSFVGTKGYELNGCDLTPRTTELRQWLVGLGLKVGSLERADFSTVNKSEKYDLVYSLGFIEHFEDYASVIRCHDRILRPGGTLVLACPNFRGVVQNWLHRKLDGKNLLLHNTTAMNPDVWADELVGIGYEIRFSGFFGGFDFWCDRSLEKCGLVKEMAIGALKMAGKLGWVFPSGAAWAPYVGLVAQKKTT